MASKTPIKILSKKLPQNLHHRFLLSAENPICYAQKHLWVDTCAFSSFLSIKNSLKTGRWHNIDKIKKEVLFLAESHSG
ncbi:MAG TPA: hypothetical protein DDW49_08485 [Deltaproteobacteria bacterium]|nr:MAG: hypothetical protein A2048_05440 [Deltaproteobacteria bacterium GWA2_45_12]HBF13402.1 hypothetical protein [Deltaproteobacteria bacterium]